MDEFFSRLIIKDTSKILKFGEKTVQVIATDDVFYEDRLMNFENPKIISQKISIFENYVKIEDDVYESNPENIKEQVYEMYENYNYEEFKIDFLNKCQRLLENPDPKNFSLLHSFFVSLNIIENIVISENNNIIVIVSTQTGAILLELIEILSGKKKRHFIEYKKNHFKFSLTPF